MTRVATDIVDVYVFRRLNARVQFLLLQRRNDVPMAQTWQAFHHEIAGGSTAPDAAQLAVNELAGLAIDRFYSADFVNQFYDEARDVVVLAPVLAVTVTDQSGVTLSDDFQDAGWFDRDEATARLPFSGQRWAVRHIDEIMSIGETESEIYRFLPEQINQLNGDGDPADSAGDTEPDELEPTGSEDDDAPLPYDPNMEPVAEASDSETSEFVDPITTTDSSDPASDSDEENTRSESR